MKLKSTLKIGVAAVIIAIAAPAIAQNNVSETDVAEPSEPAPREPVPTPAPPPPPPPVPAPVTTTDTIVTTTPAPVTIPPPDDTLDNPYANSYNELLPLEVEEDEGFDDWGLLGLLGLLGLFGLKRRERLVYVEPAPTVVTRTDRTVVRDTPPPGGPIV